VQFKWRVIGVEPFASPTLTKALEVGHPVDAEAGGLAADSLSPRRVSDRVFPIAKNYVAGSAVCVPFTRRAVRRPGCVRARTGSIGWGSYLWAGGHVYGSSAANRKAGRRMCWSGAPRIKNHD